MGISYLREDRGKTGEGRQGTVLCLAEPMAYYRYVYDSAGNIVRSIDIKALKEYNYTYESGRIIRSAEYNITPMKYLMKRHRTVPCL